MPPPLNTPEPSRALLLGTGFTGRVLARLMRSSGWDVTCTSRSGPTNTFDLAQQGTWKNLPEAPYAVWLFPAEPVDLVREFFAAHGHHWKKCVVLGTTSSFISSGQEVITESNRLDVSQPRVQGEELLRASGAIVLHSAGIYGQGEGGSVRNPVEWLNRRMAGNGTLNLIHVEDLCLAIIAALARGHQGTRYIVSDGHPVEWRTIASWAIARKLLDDSFRLEDRPGTGRRLSNARLVQELQPALRHTDVLRELESLNIQKSPETSPAP